MNIDSNGNENVETAAKASLLGFGDKGGETGKTGKISQKQLSKFLDYLEVMEPVQVFGLSKFLGVPLIKTDEKSGACESFAAEDIVVGMTYQFASLDRQKRRNLLTFLEEDFRKLPKR